MQNATPSSRALVRSVAVLALLGGAAGCGSTGKPLAGAGSGGSDSGGAATSGGASTAQGGLTAAGSAGVAGLGAAGSGGGGTARQVPDWDRALRLPDAVDLNPDPNVFETEIHGVLASTEVYPGTMTEMWTYNGSIPGPLIRAKAGDRVIVHFKNDLPEETTIHWHGIRLPNNMDGVPGVTQPAVEPGQTFDYDFVVPDASFYWYHPHVNSAKQVGDGLYGPLLVDDPSEPPLGDEVLLVLSDASVDENGVLAPADISGGLATLFGREGDVLLVNGKVRPKLQVRSGLLERWRIVNTSRSRYYQLAVAGHSFRRIGGDGGLMEAPIDSEMIVVPPAERADVLIVPQGAPGSEVAVRWVAFDRGFGSTFNRPDEPIFYLHFTDNPQVPPETLPTTSRVIEPISTVGAKEVTLELMQVSDTVDDLVLGINGVPSWEAEPLQANPGETQVWTITNNPQMEFAHPFHLHGFFFQPLDEQGAPVRPLEWKDTLNVAVKGTRRFAVHFDDREGTWMFHCHILDHADAGMMGMVNVGMGSGTHSGHSGH